MPPRRSSRANASSQSIKAYLTATEPEVDRASKRVKQEHGQVKIEKNPSVDDLLNEDEDQSIKVKRESVKHESIKDEYVDEEEKNGSNDDSNDDVDDYEALRLANIRRNAAQLQHLAIPTLALAQPKPQVKRQPARAPKPPTEPVRRSLRSRGLDPEGEAADIKPGEGRYVPHMAEYTQKAHRDGPLDMSSAIVTVRGRNSGLPSHIGVENNADVVVVEKEGDDDADDVEEEEEKESDNNPAVDRLCTRLTVMNKDKSSSSQIQPFTQDRIKSFELVGMTNKLTKKRTSAMVFHPSSTLDRSVLFTGDKSGMFNVSVFDSARHLQQNDEDTFGMCFNIHEGTVNSILCHTFSQHVFTASNDGLIRHLDVERQSIAQSFQHPDGHCIYGLASPNDSPHVLYACDRVGSLLGLDTRADPLTEITSVTLHTHKVGCIDVHPLYPHLLASSSNDRTVAIWDLRAMRDKEPLHSFVHGYSVTSALWSPTGAYLLSTCIDNKLRVFQSESQIVDEWPEPLQIYHNNKTGRWVTQFKARWSMTDDAFMIGNMDRKVDVFHLSKSQSSKASAVPLHGCFSLTSTDLTAIPSVTAMHPSNQILAASTASGYAYLWQTSR